MNIDGHEAESYVIQYPAGPTCALDDRSLEETAIADLSRAHQEEIRERFLLDAVVQEIERLPGGGAKVTALFICNDQSHPAVLAAAGWARDA